MNNIINLVPVKYSDDLILTTEQLAEFYETEIENIKKNFNRNKNKFIECKHYYFLEGANLRAFKRQVAESPEPFVSKYTSQLYLWTKKGVARHSKILGTSRAWDVFDVLESNYFDMPKQQYSLPTAYLEALKDLVVKEEESHRLQLKAEGQEFNRGLGLP